MTTATETATTATAAAVTTTAKGSRRSLICIPCREQSENLNWQKIRRIYDLPLRTGEHTEVMEPFLGPVFIGLTFLPLGAQRGSTELESWNFGGETKTEKRKD